MTNGNDQQPVMTLLQLCMEVRTVVERAAVSAWVSAEIAQVGIWHGHYYIDLVQKNDTSHAPVAKLKCVIWASQAAHIIPFFVSQTGVNLSAGMKILAFVHITMHEVSGLSGNILALDPSFTIGELEANRRAIVNRLQQDGVVDMNRSLTLPTVLKRIAVVSSAEAAGYGDFCHSLQSVEEICYDVVLYPATMQGLQAEKSIIVALDHIALAAERFDVVVIIRGGGSRTDLVCFDSYELASNVAQFPLPIIAGIGHERDKSVVDLVANMSLKTPTAVADYINNHNLDFVARMQDARRRLLSVVSMRISSHRMKIDMLSSQAIGVLNGKLRSSKLQVVNLENRLFTAARASLNRQVSKVDYLSARLQSLDPRQILRRGFTITTNADGKTITSAKGVVSGENVTTHFADGKIESVVK